MLLDSSSVISYNTCKLAEIYVIFRFSRDKIVMVSKETQYTIDTKKELKKLK